MKARRPLWQGLISLSQTKAVLIRTPGSDGVNIRVTKKEDVPSTAICFLLELQSDRLVGEPRNPGCLYEGECTLNSPKSRFTFVLTTLVLSVTVIHVQFPGHDDL